MNAKFIIEKVVLNNRLQTIIFELVIVASFIIGYVSALSVLIAPSFTALSITALFNASVVLIIINFTFSKNIYIKYTALLMLIFIYLSTFALYVNYSIYQGPISLGAVASVFETNKHETLSFFSSVELPGSVYLFFSFIFFFFLMLNELVKSNYTQPKSYFYSIVFVFLVLFMALTWREVGVKKFERGNTKESHIFTSIKKTLTRLNFTEIPRLVLNYQKQVAEFKVPLKNNWGNVISPNEEPETFVIVIGESVSSNHMSLYGYNRHTTPFLDSANGSTVINRAFSPAAVTRDSLFRSLTLNQQGKPNINLNLIGLANKASFKTYWLSNQGRIGEHDTLISRVANEAQSTFFLNKGDSTTSEYDDKLFIELDRALLNNSPKKLIVLHIMGSHMSFEDRTPERYFNNENDIIDFYDSSILFTDKILSIINEKIMPFDGKLVYFSDHGLKPINTKPYLVHGSSIPVNRKAFHVPLIFIDSASKDYSQRINQPYFMVDMMHTFANWLNIKADGLVLQKSILSKEFNSKEASSYILHPITGENVNAASLFNIEQ